MNQAADSMVEQAEDESPRTLIGATYTKLRHDIVGGRLQPGQKLRVDHLKSSYQVSSGTMREALALLVSDALVVAQGQRGFRVTSVSLADLEDLTRVRVLLETEAVRDSILLGKDDWEANLVGAFHRLTRAEERLRTDPGGSFDEWEQCNRRFHEALTAACRSRWVQRMRLMLYQQSERYRRIAATQGPPPIEVHSEHTGIFEAALARNAETACALLTIHIHRALLVIRTAGLLP
ncbi:GntR family transcriptional regulator [Ramlibacter albus]|uniref:FCD domain-containing protein n=1 Tax=Ramlibacter albus TaxID=2079448 RepID=A0A923S0W4_9BURK|nr:FCD domain-containing protein [Ramlibacter albus]MBC5763013.1 FCD domain-containing protein [Ramlibacter albus]